MGHMDHQINVLVFNALLGFDISLQFFIGRALQLCLLLIKLKFVL